MAIANRGLRHLGDQGLRVAQQQLLHVGIVVEFVLEHLTGELVRETTALNDRAAGGRLPAHEEGNADQPLVADHGYLRGRTIFEHVQQ